MTRDELLDIAVAILRLDENKNCVRIQRQLDRGQPASAGTCWWSDSEQRLMKELPEDACRYCWTSEFLKQASVHSTETPGGDA